jgi:hypothetical protein
MVIEYEKAHILSKGEFGRTQSLLLREQGRLLNEQEANYNQQRQIYETQKMTIPSMRGIAFLPVDSRVFNIVKCVYHRRYPKDQRNSCGNRFD